MGLLCTENINLDVEEFATYFASYYFSYISGIGWAECGIFDHLLSRIVTRDLVWLLDSSQKSKDDCACEYSIEQDAPALQPSSQHVTFERLVQNIHKRMTYHAASCSF